MVSQEVDDFLEHYGKKGMKWGVRKNSSGKNSSGKSKKRVSSEYKKVHELRKRNISQLSNKQLKSINERGNLEQNFNRLNPSKINKGTGLAKGIMATVGLGISAFNMYNSPAGKAAMQNGKKVMQAYQQGRRVVRNRSNGQLTLF